MNVKMFTPAQAGAIYKRLTPWFEVEPVPLKNGNWFIPVKVLQDIKDLIIDKGILDDRPTAKQKAQTIYNLITSMPTYDTEDYPQFMYDTSLDPEHPESVERQQKYADFKATYQREDI